MDPAKWPDPAAMNAELHRLKLHSMISIWPRFVPQDRYYATVLRNGWFEHLADGTPTNGLPYDRAGADIDTTNPDAAKWYWNTVRDNYIPKGFDAFWADETEPDIPPNGSYFHIVSRHGVLQRLPALPHGRVLQRHAPRHAAARASSSPGIAIPAHSTTVPIFWSSDIFPHVGRAQAAGADRPELRCQRHALLVDRHRWLAVPPRRSTQPLHPPLLDPSDARGNGWRR